MIHPSQLEGNLGWEFLCCSRLLPVRSQLRTWDSTVLAVAASLVGPLLVYYSQTAAFTWDEGFHLLAAQLILRGRSPYVDFIHTQTPLNAYWNAGWMALFGENWRVTHVVAAISTSCAVFLTADYLRQRFPVPRWRVACAFLAALAFGFNTLVVTYCTVAQAYGLCLLLLAAAFRVAVITVERDSLFLACAAGFLSGAAADSSLLTAPATPILLAWILLYNANGKRLPKAAAFVAGVIAAFSPLLYLFARAPRNVIFGVYEYNAVYRGLRWETATTHNIEVMLLWIDSSHALLLAVLAIAGLAFVRFRSDWTRAQRGEFYLCFSLTLGLGIFISTAHPTFERYFLFLVPFLSILASVGLYWIASSLDAGTRPHRAVLAVSLLLFFGLGKSLYENRDDLEWSDLEKMARRVEEVTPANGSLVAEEHVYFLTRRLPPEGMELRDSHKLDLPEELARLVHVVYEEKLDQRIRSGEFDTVEMITDGERIRKLEPMRIFSREEHFDDTECSLFWSRIAGRHSRPL